MSRACTGCGGELPVCGKATCECQQVVICLTCVFVANQVEAAILEVTHLADMESIAEAIRVHDGGLHVLDVDEHDLDP